MPKGGCGTWGAIAGDSGSSSRRSAARKIALKAYPGGIKQVEYEIEENGAASYEFEIITKDGKRLKVEVDASSGKIVEVSEKLDQPGKK